jgi:hypothetical protein
MKYLLSFSLLLLIISCQQGDCSNGVLDGNETSVDCGGDCENNCVNLDSVFKTAPILKEIQGKWYNNLSISRIIYHYDYGSRRTDGSVHFSSCPIEFTTNNSSLSNLLERTFAADMHGDLDNESSNCNYPKKSQYTYNLESQSFTLPSNTLMQIINKTLIASFLSESITVQHFLEKEKMNYASVFNEVFWEIEVMDQELINGSVEFLIQEDFQKESVVSKIMENGRSQYFGIIHGFTGNEPSISIKAKATSNKARGFILFNARLIMNKEIISECVKGYFCINESNCAGEQLTTEENQVLNLTIYKP